MSSQNQPDKSMSERDQTLETMEAHLSRLPSISARLGNLCTDLSDVNAQLAKLEEMGERMLKRFDHIDENRVAIWCSLRRMEKRLGDPPIFDNPPDIDARIREQLARENEKS